MAGVKSSPKISAFPENALGAAEPIEKILCRFPEIVARAAAEYKPHYVALYLLDLAAAFNAFYGSGQIVNREDLRSPYRVALTEAFAIVVKNGLTLLGIKVPEKM
jgi:arginyl-tRNA synthetase